MVEEQAHTIGAGVSAVVVPCRSHGSVVRFVFGLMLWLFGLPGAGLLAGLAFVAPAAASVWAWFFAGFWMLVAAAGRAVDLALGDTR